MEEEGKLELFGSFLVLLSRKTLDEGDVVAVEDLEEGFKEEEEEEERVEPARALR